VPPTDDVAVAAGTACALRSPHRRDHSGKWPTFNIQHPALLCY
jgi:hypothetical protein